VDYLGKEICTILPYYQSRKNNDIFSQRALQLSAAILGREKIEIKQNKKTFDLSSIINRFSKK
jgi:hypothetical protein